MSLGEADKSDEHIIKDTEAANILAFPPKKEDNNFGMIKLFSNEKLNVSVERMNPPQGKVSSECGNNPKEMEKPIPVMENSKLSELSTGRAVRARFYRCRVCAGCRAQPCGACAPCRDKKVNGGRGKMHKPCV